MAKATKTVTRYVKTKRRRRKGFTLPLAVVAGFAPLTIGFINDVKSYGMTGAGAGLSARLTGYNPQVKTWSLWTMKEGLFPIVGGILVHKVAGKLGVNRALGRSGLPWIRI
jgi:hypothetical protein